MSIAYEIDLVQKNHPENSICVLDAYHRNRAIGKYVTNMELAGELRALLYAGKIPDLLKRLETAGREAADEQEKNSLEKLLRYYTENKNALTGYYDRGIEIPPTSQPGVIHHARLGSMESNIFTLIGNRMKGRRACWSVQGADHLALLLCRRYSVCCEDFFSQLPPLPQPVSPEPENAGNPLSAAEIPERVGKSGQCYCHATLPNKPWLKRLSAYSSFIDMKF